MSKELRRCTRCVMDTTDSAITFDSEGVCDHCRLFETSIIPSWNFGKDKSGALKQITEKIRLHGQNKSYDCILGLSGGVDSSFLCYLAHKLGLRPLIFHVDAGWNTKVAVNNIEKLVDNLGLDLYTEVINWEEMKDLQIAFFKSGVSHIDAPQDHAFFATMYHFAEKNNIRYILTGANYSTECIRNPLEWMYYQSDSTQLNDIHQRFGKVPLKTFPRTNILRHKVLLPYFKKIKVVDLLNYIDYQKESAWDLLEKNFWLDPL
jgi:N-acetyl sugar amidotransferase